MACFAQEFRGYHPRRTVVADTKSAPLRLLLYDEITAPSLKFQNKRLTKMSTQSIKPVCSDIVSNTIAIRHDRSKTS